MAESLLVESRTSKVEGWGWVNGARVVPTRSTSALSSRCGLGTIRAPKGRRSVEPVARTPRRTAPTLHPPSLVEGRTSKVEGRNCQRLTRRGATPEISRGQRPRTTPHKTIRPGRGGGHHPRPGRHHSRAPSGRMLLPDHFPGIPSPANFHQPSVLTFGFPDSGMFRQASTVSF
jgi:hypothetical protein